MGGIAGIVRFDRPSFSQEERLNALVKALLHRGPDGKGTYFATFAALAATRQTIVDAVDGGQPMHSWDGRYVIVFDGEVYNHEELRAELRDRWSFRSASDTEVVMAAYDRWGGECLERLNGMFAFFVWDEEAKCGFAARDGLGAKPFVYRFRDGELLFASEAKALLKVLPPPRASRRAILEYLVAPGFSGVEQPMFEGLEYLAPGHALAVSRGGLELSRWWDYEIPSRRDEDPEWLAEEMRTRITAAVRRTLSADVPVGLYPPGGVDSTLLAALASREPAFRAASGSAPHAYTVQFAGQDTYDYRRSLLVNSDDTPYAESAAGHLRLRQQLVCVDPETLRGDLARLAAINDALPAWEHELAQHRLAWAASRHYKAVLVGEVADETHYGYPFLLEEMATRSPGHVLRRFADAPIRRDALPETASGVPPADAVAYFNDRYEELCRASGQDWPRPTGRISAATYLLVKRWLARLLHNVDIHAMAWGLEARLPFADATVIDLARRIPPALGLRDGVEKWLLRQTGVGLMPESILWRRRSARPKDQTAAAVYQAEAERLVLATDDFLGELLDLERLRPLWDRARALSESERALLFRVVMLAHWVRHYGVRPG